jgi:hypothetical protein
MAARQSLDDKLAALRALRGQRLTDEQKAELRKRLRHAMGQRQR